MEFIAFLLDFIVHVDVHLATFVQTYGTWVYALLFLILFVETGVVVMPFLPGDSLLFVVGVAQMTRRKFTLYDVTGGVLWVGSVTLAGYLFGNIPWVKAHLSHIIWAMILIPGLLILFGAWKSRRTEVSARAV